MGGVFESTQRVEEKVRADAACGDHARERRREQTQVWSGGQRVGEARADAVCGAEGNVWEKEPRVDAGVEGGNVRTRRLERAKGGGPTYGGCTSGEMRAATLRRGAGKAVA